MARVGFIRPNNDRQAQTLYDWGSSVRGVVASSPGHSVGCDVRPRWIWRRLTRSEVLSGLATADIVLYFGHGEADHWLGDSPLLDSRDAAVTAGKVVVAIACDTAQVLGAACVTAGATAYLGFKDRVTWSNVVPSEYANVLTTALSPFLRYDEPIGSVALRLREGFRELAVRYKTGSQRGHPDATVVWLSANENAKHVVLHGDSSAKA